VRLNASPALMTRLPGVQEIHTGSKFVPLRARSLLPRGIAQPQRACAVASIQRAILESRNRNGASRRRCTNAVRTQSDSWRALLTVRA
jgi:hypothetical protein